MANLNIRTTNAWIPLSTQIVLVAGWAAIAASLIVSLRTDRASPSKPD